jgi:hypothetical protein
MNTKKWLYGIGSAVISSAAGSVAVIVVDPKDFNLTNGLPKLGAVAFVFALIALGNYLKDHPLPEWDGVDRRQSKDQPL